MASRPKVTAPPKAAVKEAEPVRSQEEEALADKMARFRDAIPRGGNVAAEAIAVLTRHIQNTLDMSKELGHKSTDLAPIYRRVRDAVENVQEVMKQFVALTEIMNKHIIPEAFERDNITTLTTSEGDRVTTTTKVFASILAENREEAYEWLRNNDYGDVIKETVNASTLSSLAGELLAENKELPDDIFNTAIVPQTSLTRAKAKKPK
jgi:hypothetical protein